MPPIKSINAPRMWARDGEIQQTPILTQAIPEPPKPTKTYYSPERIIAMTLYQDKLYVATENGVYMKGDEGVFWRLKFQIVEEENQ